MKFLANENFPYPSSNILQAKGYEVILIAKTNPGITDLEVIKIAEQTNAIILTFDKDYGEIIFKHRIPILRQSFFSEKKEVIPFLQDAPCLTFWKMKASCLKTGTPLLKRMEYIKD